MNYDDWKSIVKESSALLLIMMFIEVIGGGVLNSMEAVFTVFPIILSFVPVINAVGGNIGAVMGARLSSALHLGSVKAELSDRGIRENAEISLVIGFLAILIAAISLYVILPIMGLSVLMTFANWIEIVLISSGIVVSTVVPLSAVTTIWAFGKGKSPDDFTIPVVSTFGDFVGIMSILIAVKMVVP